LIAAGSPAGQALAGEASADKVREGLEKVLPGVEPDSIRPAPLDNLYEVVIGPQLVYVSGDGRYLFQGSIVDLQSRTNLTEPRRRAAVAEAVDAEGEENMIIFGKPDSEYTVSVFTDIDCGYCRKLHGEIEAFNDKGIRVRYLFFPRAGVDSDSYNKAVSVWCAEDSQAALTDAKAGKPVPELKCDNPVKEQMRLGEAVGVSGTPALVLPDGELLPGYVPPSRLAAYLEAKKTGAH
jgi:thiol:disulfide interchange protein DsbC